MAKHNIKNIKTHISLFDSFKIKSAGQLNNEIQNKLNPYVPIIEVILIISNWLEKLYAIKFQGKPVKIDPLINSKIPNNNEKIKNEFVTLFTLKIVSK